MTRETGTPWCVPLLNRPKRRPISCCIAVWRWLIYSGGRRQRPRLMIELAGIAYREKQFSEAKRNLRRALTLNPNDDYANNFLASIYFQEGNLEAALKYWNRAGKPKLEDLTFQPALKLRPLVLDRAFSYARGAEWRS